MGKIEYLEEVVAVNRKLLDTMSELSNKQTRTLLHFGLATSLLLVTRDTEGSLYGMLIFAAIVVWNLPRFIRCLRAFVRLNRLAKYAISLFDLLKEARVKQLYKNGAFVEFERTLSSFQREVDVCLSTLRL